MQNIKAAMLAGVVTALLLFAAVPLCLGEDYKDLEPGVSRKSDVDKLLGSPKAELIKGLRYEYTPLAEDTLRVLVEFFRGNQVVKTIEIYPRDSYLKSQYMEWFELKKPERIRHDENGQLIEYYISDGTALHYMGSDDSSSVEFFSYFDRSSSELTPVDGPPKNTFTINQNVDLLMDDFDLENNRKGSLNFSNFKNWEVINGAVDIIGNGFWDFFPEHGLYVDLDGSKLKAGTLVLKTPFRLEPGKYRLEFDLAGSPLSGPNNVTVTLGNSYREDFTMAMKAPFRTITRDISVSSPEIANLSFEHYGGDNQGLLLDNVRLSKISDSHVPKTDTPPETELDIKDDLLMDDFDLENKSKGSLNYSAFTNWEVVTGTVDVIGNGFFDFYPEYGLYVDLDGSTSKAGTIVSKTAFRLEPGKYRLEFDLAGNPSSGPNIVTVTLGNSYREDFTMAMKAPFRTITRDISVLSPEIANLSFEHYGGDNQGLLLDNIKLGKISVFHTPGKETPPLIPEDEAYYIKKSDVAIEQKDWMKAKRVIDEGLRKYPNSAELWQSRAIYYFKGKAEPKRIWHVEAQRSMERAYDLNPSAKHAAEMGWLYRELHSDCETALSYFEEAERKGYVREQKTLLYWMGWCYEKRGYIATAREYYRHLIDTAPENEKAKDARERLQWLR